MSSNVFLFHTYVIVVISYQRQVSALIYQSTSSRN